MIFPLELAFMGHQILLMPAGLIFTKEMNLLTINNRIFLLALVAHSPLLVCTSSTVAPAALLSWFYREQFPS